MIKQLIYLLIASLIIVLFASFFNHLLTWLQQLHHLLQNTLTQVFANSQLGQTITGLLSLFLVPLVIMLVVSGVYLVFKKKPLPQQDGLLWAVWLVLATTLVLH
mgnify:CR=1 FL=1|jgi:hypothetical protein